MAEYIDRVEYCKNYCRCSNEYCDKESCPIWKAPAANVEPVKRWIPCSKALPNTRERVLATDGVFVGEMCINKRSQWERYNVTNYETLMSLDILAWMPLPEPPEMDGGVENE